MNQDEFVQTIREHEALIHKVCNLYRHTLQDRQDLFQEIVIQLWKAFPSFRGDSKITTWMYRVALNTSISDFRKQLRSIDTVEMEHLPVDPKDHSVEDEHQEKLNLLYRLINQLSEVDKALIMLYLDDRSYEEMEEIVGINQNNLRVKINRIKERLRTLTKTTTYGA